MHWQGASWLKPSGFSGLSFTLTIKMQANRQARFSYGLAGPMKVSRLQGSVADPLALKDRKCTRH